MLYPRVYDRLFGVPGSWTFRECTNAGCRLMWLHPRPSVEALAGFYEGYYTHEPVTAGAAAPRRSLRSLAGSACDLALRLVGVPAMRDDLVRLGLVNVPPGRMLEVGCGSGTRLMRYARCGWEVEGQEVDREAARLARSQGLHVHEGALEDLQLRSDTYDAIVADHVIEHVFDPSVLLRECHRILKPGGRIFLAAPNASSAGHARFRECWVGLDAPRHLWVFRVCSLRDLLAAARFECVESRTTPANAEFFYAVSEEIRLQGSANILRPRSIRASCVGKLGQLASISRWRHDPQCGEECVLVGRKP